MSRPFSQNTSQHLFSLSRLYLDTSAGASVKRAATMALAMELRLQCIGVYCHEAPGTLNDNYEVGTIADPDKYGIVPFATLNAMSLNDYIEVEMTENDVTLGDAIIITTPVTAVQAGIFTFDLIGGFTGPITTRS